MLNVKKKKKIFLKNFIKNINDKLLLLILGLEIYSKIKLFYFNLFGEKLNFFLFFYSRCF